MFDAEAVRERLAGLRFGRLNYARETGSTNDDAAQLLGDQAAAGSILVAEYQRHGRGRRGRRWIAPAGSALLFTAILPEPIAATALWVVPFWCALAVADGIEAALGVSARAAVAERLATRRPEVVRHPQHVARDGELGLGGVRGGAERDAPGKLSARSKRPASRISRPVRTRLIRKRNLRRLISRPILRPRIFPTLLRSLREKTCSSL